MNERIKQIAEQAKLNTLLTRNVQDVIDGCMIVSPAMVDEFARLIIEEAAAYLVGATEVHNQREQDLMNTAAKKMTEHFTKRMPKCSVCGTTDNVTYMGGYQPYLCDSNDCIPF